MPEPVVITLIENNEETDTADEFEVDMSCYTSTCIFQKCNMYCFVLFDLILYVHSTIFQLCGTGLPGLNQY